MDYNMTGFPVFYYLPELAQTHVHWVSQWCHQTILSSVIPFSSCLLSFPKSGSFLMSWLLASGSQSTGASTSFITPSNEYSGLISFRMDWFDVLAESKGLSRVFSSTTVQKHQFFGAQPSLNYNQVFVCLFVCLFVYLHILHMKVNGHYLDYGER